MKFNYKRVLSAFLCFLLMINICSASLGRCVHATTIWSEFERNDVDLNANGFEGVGTNLKGDAVVDIEKSKSEVLKAFGRDTTFDITAQDALLAITTLTVGVATGGVGAMVIAGGALSGLQSIGNAASNGIDTNKAIGRINKVNENVAALWAIIRDVLNWLIAFGEITSVIVCLIAFMKLATAPSHPMQRRNCMVQIITAIITSALLGGLALILNVFYSTFSKSLSSGVIYSNDWRVGGTSFLVQYGNLVAGFSGIASLTMLLCMGYSFTKLALSGGNPQKKQQAMTGIITTVLATAGVGGVTTFVSMLTGLLK